MTAMRTVACVALVAMLVAGDAVAGTRSVDVKDAPGVAIRGAYKVRDAGDVNGDGIPDIIVSEGGLVTPPTEGITYVVFGGNDLGNVDLDALGPGGFVIHGGGTGDFAAESTSAGDVNGDGRDDILIGAPGADNNGKSESGATYVVFGKTDTEPVRLADFDAGIQMDQGFRIDGAYPGDYSGRSVAGVGDINGDGLDDIMTGATFGGASYVVFGKSDWMPVDLLTYNFNLQGDTGFRISTPGPRWDNGYTVEAAGDVNADGIPDVVIGVDNPASKTFVVFGKSDGDPVNVRGRFRGFTIRHAGSMAIGIGNFNGDRFDDLAVGASIVFGKKSTGTLNRWKLGKHGIYIDSTYDDFGFEAGGRRFAAVGDVNGDRLDDVLFGSPYAERKRKNSGSVYLIYGKRSRTDIDLRRLKRGYRIDGRGNDTLGLHVGAIGDVNGDAVPDFVIGAPGLKRNGGRTYVVWGQR